MLTPVERVLARTVITPNGCVEWTGYRDARGYGQIKIGGRRGQLLLVHRVVFESDSGPLAHLFAGTRADNSADMVVKGRHFNQRKTHCPAGHDYAAFGRTVPTRSGGTGRVCVLCTRATKRRYRLRQKVA